MVAILALASVLIVNAVAIGTGGQIALARHHDNTNVFENSYINIPTDTNQRQDCKTAGGTSPISDSCTASSSNTISQGSSCTPTMHPTVLTLNVSPPNELGEIVLTGTLIDTCTGLGVASVIITFIGAGVPSSLSAVTNAAGIYTINLPAVPPGASTIQAHFAGQGIFGPSNSGTVSFTVQINPIE